MTDVTQRNYNMSEVFASIFHHKFTLSRENSEVVIYTDISRGNFNLLLDHL